MLKTTDDMGWALYLQGEVDKTICVTDVPPMDPIYECGCIQIDVLGGGSINNVYMGHDTNVLVHVKVITFHHPCI